MAIVFAVQFVALIGQVLAPSPAPSSRHLTSPHLIITSRHLTSPHLII
jgi:hypothetical protein